ncbi:two-component regulator propeller domain-containing protein [uncultured Alistipes sp.]|uniref:two-component regulator propeller domain-containing protein n=1 Tax=uncultured Alistipes sp. TaxID=538949 RepID=UPI0025D6EEA7|nr:two-component regulator propeller domain-containing protein [uncultured Alistipes sp.]
MKRLLLILVLLLAGAEGFAQPNPPQCIFHYYSTLDGLTHDRIADIYTDSRGLVWVCTWYGVSRFDGYTFRNFSTSPADYSPLSHHRFISVSEDSNGHLWFTTYNLHVYRLNRYTEQFEDVVSLIDDVNSQHYRVGHCMHDGDGGTWVAIAGEGVVRFTAAADQSPVGVDAFFRTATLGGDVAAMHIDDRNNAWIASTEGQLNYIAAGEYRTAPRKICTTDAPGFAFAADESHVYCITPRSVIRTDKQGAHATQLQGSGADLTAIAADSVNRTVYAGSRTGELYRVAGDRLSRLTPKGVRPRRIRDLDADSHGILWVTSAEAGITRYNPATDDYKHFEQEPYTVSYNLDTITKIAEGGGRLWIKMNKYGFGYYDREKDRVEPFYNDPKLPNCEMTNAVVRFDVHDDVLWLSTYYERGLRKAVILEQPADVFSLDAYAPAPAGSGLSGEIRALMNDSRDRMWVGTRDGELICFDADRNPVYRLPAKGGKGLGMIYALKEDSSGNIWVGTKGEGLYRMTPGGEGYAVTHFVHSDSDDYSLNDDQVYSIEEDYLGRIWVATYGGGINILENPNGRRFIHAANLLTHYPLGEAGRVRWLLYDRPDRMFAATVDGLLVFNPSLSFKQMRFELVQKIPGDASSLGNNDIIHMLKDSQERIWLATYGGGLNLIDGYDGEGKPRFRCYDTTRGISSNICMALTEDAMGDLWVSTHNAVSRFDPRLEVFSNYMLYDNMRNAIFSEATALTSARGDVLFGSGRRLYSFDPEKIRAARIDYKLRFTGLDVRNHPVVAGPRSPLAEAVTEAEEIVLPYNFSNFRMEFASLNFAIQHLVGYMYKLEGYDQDWNISGTTNRAAYSNVPIGNYTLHVKAFAGNTDAADEGITIGVKVLPPLWLTWWAKVLYALLALAAVYIALRITNSVMRIRREASVEQNMTDLKLRFFTNISHELRTPLTLILGGIEEVKKHDDLSTRGDVSLTLAHRNAKRMLTLINQLLDFRKIVKEKMELKISRVDLVPVVEDALDDFRELAAERKIELLFTVSRRSILVWVDIERIESVVYNLLSNALKFTPIGGKVEVVLTLSEEDESVTLTVRDTGIGIPKDKLASIFERFVQASRAVDSNMKGSGIGLSLCRDIVGLHHGEITVDSRPGEGAAFSVKLKLGNAHFGMEQIDFSGAGGSDGKKDYMVSDFTPADSQRRMDVQPPEGAQKILLVEDNRELRIFMYNSLIDSYHVVEADDGVEALEKIRTEMPDIIITDLMMPRMDGIELIDKVRHDFTMSHIPIVMLTARHSPDDRVKAMEYGADGYITKPFSIELLLARIDNLLTQRQKLFEKFSTQSARNKVVELVVEDVVVTDRDEEFMKNVMAWLGEHIEDSELTIDQLASHLGLGRTTMYNKLKSLTGKSPIELIKEYRITKSKLLLRTGQFSVSEVAYKVGFSDPGYFSRCFREQFNMSPAEYLKNHNLKQNQDTKTT